MDHSTLHKANTKRRDSEARNGQKVKRRSLAQKEKRDIVLEKQRKLSPLRERNNAKKTKAGPGNMPLKDRLKEWKKERDVKKKQEKQKAKPVFKVSTTIKRNDNLLAVSKQGKSEVLARNTRSKTSGSKITHSETKQNEKKIKRNGKPVKREVIDPTEKESLNEEDKENKKDITAPERMQPTLENDQPSKSNSTQATETSEPCGRISNPLPLSDSFAPPNFAFKAPTGLRKFHFNPTMPNSNESFIYSSKGKGMNFLSSTPLAPQLTTNKKPTPVPMVISSASGSSSDEDIKKRKLAVETPKKPTSEIRLKDEKVLHFRNLITTESEILTTKCKKWEEIQDHHGDFLAEEVVGEIRSVIGQAQLLMAERFVQFSDLVDKYETPKPDHNPVTPTDLKGFWDMIYYQVEDVMNKFKNLEHLKENGWKREEEIKKKATRKRKVSKTVKGSSAHRRAARKRIKEAREAMKAKLQQKEDDSEESKKESLQEEGQGSSQKQSTSSVTGSIASIEEASSQDEGVVTRSRRKTPGKKNVSFVSPSSKKRKARFDLEESDTEKKETPVRSQPRKRVMRKTPLPGSRPDSVGDDETLSNEDIQASPTLKISTGIVEASKPNKDNPNAEMKGVKLNFDDVPSDEECFETKYLLPAENGPPTEYGGGLDMKYLLPSTSSDLNEEKPIPSLGTFSTKEKVAESPVMVLRSGRKTHHNPISPFLKPANEFTEAKSEGNDLISFSPAPAKPVRSSTKNSSIQNLDRTSPLPRRSTRLVSRLDSLEDVSVKDEAVALIPSLL